VIDGYSIPTRKGTKEIPGLGGDFAYLRCRRISSGRLLDIEHEQVWTALQMIHGDTLAAYEKADFLLVKEEDGALAYVPRFRKELVPELRKALKGCASAIVYSWQPEMLRQQIRSSNVQHEAIPESLARRFGLKG
jgi:adenine-specific DNA-methyltransferase